MRVIDVNKYAGIRSAPNTAASEAIVMNIKGVLIIIFTLDEG